jgi:DNA-binding MarR family transcriptional regulator
MASNLGMTDRNLRRILKRLEGKGLVVRRYTFYKKLRIFLVSLETQIQIWKNIVLNRITVFDQRKNIVKKTIGAAATSWLTQLSNSFRKKSYRTYTSEPIKEENISIINTQSKFEFLGIKQMSVKKPLTDVQLNNKKNEQLLKFRAHLMQTTKG